MSITIATIGYPVVPVVSSYRVIVSCTTNLAASLTSKELYKPFNI